MVKISGMKSSLTSNAERDLIPDAIDVMHYRQERLHQQRAPKSAIPEQQELLAVKITNLQILCSDSREKTH